MCSVIVDSLIIKHQSAQPPAKAYQYFSTYISPVKRSEAPPFSDTKESLVFNTAAVVKGAVLVASEPAVRQKGGRLSNQHNVLIVSQDQRELRVNYLTSDSSDPSLMLPQDIKIKSDI